MQTLKVSNKSNPSAIAGFIREGTEIELQSIGAGATNQAVKVVAIARGYVAPQDVDLSCIPAFINLKIDDEERTGLKIFLDVK